MVAQYLRELLPERLHEVARPTMFFRGQIVDDLYFTTDLSGLARYLCVEDREIIAAQTEPAGRAGHDAAGVLATDLGDLTLQAASLANHGERFHRLFIEPVAEKFVAGGTADVLASHRRKVWLPLFWPETLHAAATCAPTTFEPYRPFHTVTGGGVGEIVVALRARLAALGVQIENNGRLMSMTPVGDATDLRFERGAVRAVRPIIGTGTAETFVAGGADYNVTKAQTALAWVEVPEADLVHAPSVMTVVDADLPISRVSLSDPVQGGTVVVTVELRHDVEEAEMGTLAIDGLRRMGLVTGPDVRVLKTAHRASFALPSRANHERHDRARAHLNERGFDCRFVGGTEAFGADTLSEQIIQALIAVEELRWH